MNKYIGAFACMLLLAACGSQDATKENGPLRVEGETIIVEGNSPILKQIVVEKTQLEEFSSEFRTVGTVRPVSGKYAEITPPFAGRVSKSFVQLGQRVGVGAPVFELSSSEFYEATKAYFAAQSANELARRNHNRQKELVANGVGAQRELEQAQSEADIASQEFEQAKAILQIFNIDLATLQMGNSLKVVSPISGEIVKYNITIGNYIKEDSEPLAVVADLSQVWVAALVKEKYFGSIKQGDRVEVFTSADPEKIIWGTIYHIGKILDEETRSLEVIVQCDNTDSELKLGMFCEAHFLSAPTKAIILPSTAIMQEEESDYLFLEVEKGKYIRRKVETESVSPESVRILSGLSEGEQVVTKGGIYLNI
ncbi:efflux RND transporter periplasmic adaptor subunit [Parabacteroides sp. PF5-9]|uniref:efflux RND transporter periplasmic adaptor subunit n=1 Tax=Parabacteroides sp. PF5-9 TaxID=1742404 RepID=UPI0024768316|nr:efflux RND transporter periplasmic adaptor subunit [Parabacteroides sp. PF5-9]MDH6357510.1 cobalt-zinc-cadmium efflux system membrane fusion protein [Parabacteroides sp. PF5-9]